MKGKYAESATFSMGRFHCYSLMVMEQAPWAAWSLLVAVVLLVAGGFLISPWAGVAAFGVAAFLAVMVMSFVIMAYGVYSITGVNMAPHSLAVDGHRILVRFDEGDDVEVMCEHAAPYKIYPGGVLVPVEGARAGWLWVPSRAFDHPDALRDFLKLIYRPLLIEDESYTE